MLPKWDLSLTTPIEHYQIIHSRITGNKHFSLISGKAGYSTLKKSTYRIKSHRWRGFWAQLVVLIDGLYTILSRGVGWGKEFAPLILTAFLKILWGFICQKQKSFSANTTNIQKWKKVSFFLLISSISKSRFEFHRLRCSRSRSCSKVVLNHPKLGLTMKPETFRIGPMQRKRTDPSSHIFSGWHPTHRFLNWSMENQLTFKLKVWSTQ